jgi:hypothetical protein
VRKFAVAANPPDVPDAHFHVLRNFLGRADFRQGGQLCQFGVIEK